MKIIPLGRYVIWPVLITFRISTASSKPLQVFHLSNISGVLRWAKLFGLRYVELAFDISLEKTRMAKIASAILIIVTTIQLFGHDMQDKTGHLRSGQI